MSVAAGHAPLDLDGSYEQRREVFLSPRSTFRTLQLAQRDGGTHRQHVAHRRHGVRSRVRVGQQATGD